MDVLTALLPCLNPRKKDIASEKLTRFPNGSKKDYVTLSEKTNDHTLKQPVLTTHEAAASIASVLLNAEKNGRDLTIAVEDIVHQAGGWSEYFAAAVLTAVENVLKAGSQMNQAMSDAYKKACDEAMKIEAFAHEHPVLTGVFCTVVAIGILVILAPYVLGALGFAEGGIVEGSWAAIWQATYRGFVPKKSLFSYLQRLGMKYGK